MRKHLSKTLSLILAFSMCLALLPQVYAAEAEPQPTTAEEIAAPSEIPENGDSAAIDDSDESEKYTQNIVLFAMDSSSTADDISSDLSALGISSVEPLFTENGEAVGIGKKKEIWYRAYTSEEVTSVIEKITALGGVTYAEPEYIYSSDNYGEPTEVEQGAGWIFDSLLKHKSDFWWYTALNHDTAPGSGSVVAVIDTGVDYTHEDLAPNMWVNTAELYGTEGVDDDGNGYIDDIYGVDVTASGKKAGNPMDDNGHGTHVAGIIGMSANGTGGVGLAYGSKIMAIKAGYSTGSLASSAIAKAINYAHMMGADVINMSFGGTSKSYLIESALEDAFSDCVLVASAGNDGLPTTDADPALYPKREDIYPAAYSYVIGVMATDKFGTLAGFSNWDYKVNANAEYELTAPGVSIYSALPGNRYALWSGTSMAAPCVSAAAAILRSHFGDKDTYSSRFIMGQLTSATNDRTTVKRKEGDNYKIYTYPALDIYDSVNNLPKPNISVKKVFAMDNAREDNALNDGDNIIDAGETIDLGVMIRNQWGLTGNITVTADAVSVGGVANPYIEFTKPEITISPAGTFAESNNGFVWEDSLLTDVENPIQFKVSPETPNDTEICVNLTVTTTNGYDENDKAAYTAEYAYTFRVQSGRGIKGEIKEDTTLTKDYLWIVENTVHIPEGVTLTVEPGTKIQFYSSDYEDAYGGMTMPKILNDGTLNIIGTEEEPIEMYPGAGFEQYCVEIAGDGIETLKYCNIINPRLGSTERSASKPVNLVDHCTLTQTDKEVSYRYVNDSGRVSSSCFGFNHYIGIIINTLIYGFVPYGIDCNTLYTNKIKNCILNSCRVDLNYTQSINNVFMTGDVGLKPNIEKSSSIGYWTSIKKPTSGLTLGNSIYTYDGASSKYITATIECVFSSYASIDYSAKYDLLNAAAKSLGGTLACVNDDVEKKFISSKFSGCFIGCLYNSATGKYEWEDGSTYPVEIADSNNSPDSPYVYISGSKFYSISYVAKAVLEIPADKTDEEIRETLENFDVNAALEEILHTTTNNAILNPVLNTNPQSWAQFIANSYDSDYFDHYLYNNYWGTENKTLINKMIVDADDYSGTYQDIIEDPILTLESESLSEIYPFVTRVYLEDGDGNEVTSAAPGQEVKVHVLFNRDMATDVQPSVCYGPDTPYTDFSVSGDFVSPREWVGTTKISPVMTDGTMYFRTKGGCAADDRWLVCGEDILRFSFEVSTSGVLAMMLNAEGGTNKVELSWAQNDYDTLAGYNLYRSESETSNFTKINQSILTGTSYTDTDVKPGVTYYYYFKVVNTDGNEYGGASNTTSAAPIDNIFPVLTHSPIKTAKAGSQVTVSATATDNIAVSTVKLYYRKTGESEFKVKDMTESATKNLYVAVIPAAEVTAAGTEYYVTASDADGNISYSGTAQIPNAIDVNSTPYISGITPSSVNADGGRTITVLGGNFAEDMVLKLGGNVISDVSFVNSGQLSFAAPAMNSGSYALTLTTTDGTVITSPTPLSYTDSASMAQIPTSMTMVSGIPYTIPLYISASGGVQSLHAELDLPSSDFTSVKVEKADESASFSLEYNYSGGVLKIGCSGSGDITPADGALLNIIVTPRATEDKQYTITLHDAAFNGAAVTTMISGNVHIKPSYTLSASVKYFMGENNFVSGITVSAAGVSGITDENGSTSLVVSDRNVSVSAMGLTAANAVTAYDAALVLQSAVGKISLSDNQLLAADVSGDGSVNEYDASLILQKAVRKIDAFPLGRAWIFTPSYIDKTLGTSANSVTFTAISPGDVDGSYRGDEQ